MAESVTLPAGVVTAGERQPRTPARRGGRDRCTSRRRTPPTSGPSGVSMNARSPAINAGARIADPRRDAGPAPPRLQPPRAASRSGASKSVASRTRCTRVPTWTPGGQVGQQAMGTAVAERPPPRVVRAAPGAPASAGSFLDDGLLRLARDAGLVGPGGDVAVGRAAARPSRDRGRIGRPVRSAAAASGSGPMRWGIPRGRALDADAARRIGGQAS